MARLWILPAVLAALFLASTASGQSVEVRVGPTVQDGEESELLPDAPTEWTVGDRIPVTVVLTVPLALTAAPPADGVAWPWAEGIGWGEAEVRTVFPAVGPLPIDGDSQTVRYQQRLEMAAFRPGEIPLPPVTIPITPQLTVETPADLALTLTPVLEPEADNPQPSGFRSLVGLGFGRAFWWVNGGLALLCLGLALAALFRRRLAGVGVRVFGSDPLAALEKILEALRTEPAAEPFHTRLSLALRRYLGERLAFPAEESTTPEISRETRRRLPPPVHARLEGLLAECDGVKFARQGADERSMAGRRQTAGEAAHKVEDWWRRRAHRPETARDRP